MGAGSTKSTSGSGYADGWLYFLVRDTNTNKHFVAASDAALLMQQAAPVQ